MVIIRCSRNIIECVIIIFQRVIFRGFHIKTISLNFLVVLVQPNISNAKDVVLSEGRNFSIHYDVEANFPPQVKWFRNGVHIADDGYLMTLEAVGLKSNLTVYRAKLTKSVIRSNESGLYHAMISYGPIVYSLDSFDVKVEGKFLSFGKSNSWVKENEITLVRAID